FFKKSWTTFHSAMFNELNKDKVENIIYLLFQNECYCLGICFGIRDNILISPFSSPFGGIEYKGSCSEHDYTVAIDELAQYLNENYQSYSIQVTLPPVCYD